MSIVRIRREAAVPRLNSRHTIHERVVRLHVHGNSAVGETFDHVRLPQRPMPIEQRAVEHGGQLEQLADSTGLGSASNRT